MGRFTMENDRLAVTLDDLGAELVREIRPGGNVRHRFFSPMWVSIMAASTCIRADIMFRISMVLPEIMSWNGWKRVEIL